MNKKIWLGLALASAISCAYAQEQNIIRTPAPISFVSQQAQGEWLNYERLLVDEQIEKTCTAWLPDASTQASGYLFLQSRSCNPIVTTRTYQDREQNSTTLDVRNKGVSYQETSTTSANESQQTYGTGQSGSVFNLTTARFGSASRYGFASSGYVNPIGSMTPVVYNGRTIHQMFMENISGTCYFKFDIGGFYANLLPNTIIIDGQRFDKPAGGWHGSATSPYQYSGPIVNCSLYSSWMSGSHVVEFIE